MSDFEDAKLILTPNAYKAGKAYCVKPFDGSGDFTVVRNTTATRIDENGLIESVAANVPRLNYPIGGGCPSWLIEPQATNFYPYSEDFSQSVWVKQNSSVNLESVINPYGTLNVYSLSSSVSGSNIPIIRDAVSVLTNTLYTVSIFVKSGDVDFFQITFGSGQVSGNPRVNFNVLTGDVEDSDITNCGVEDYENGYYRCWVTVETLSTLIQPYFINIKSGTDTRFQANTWNLTDALYLFGAQLEQGGLTSYIPTNGAAVTRNADVLTSAPPTGTTEIVETLKDITYYIGGRNLLTNSEDFSQSSWSKVGGTINSNSSISPILNELADDFVEDSVNSQHRLRQDIAVTAGTYYFSCYLKSSDRNVSLYPQDAGVAFAVFNLQSGTIINTGGTDYLDSFIFDEGDGWFRCVLKYSVSLGISKVHFYLTEDTSSAPIYQGNGASKISIIGAQLEENTLTDYQATRDIVTVPTTYQLPNGEIKKVIMK